MRAGKIFKASNQGKNNVVGKSRLIETILHNYTKRKFDCIYLSVVLYTGAGRKQEESRKKAGRKQEESRKKRRLKNAEIFILYSNHHHTQGSILINVAKLVKFLLLSKHFIDLTPSSATKRDSWRCRQGAVFHCCCCGNRKDIRKGWIGLYNSL